MSESTTFGILTAIVLVMLGAFGYYFFTNSGFRPKICKVDAFLFCAFSLLSLFPFVVYFFNSYSAKELQFLKFEETAVICCFLNFYLLGFLPFTCKRLKNDIKK
jgi:hypothetical protein